jgi:polysaccharide export outer membrane protein
VLGLKEFSQPLAPWLSVTVSNSGKIRVPFAGILHVANMSPSEVASLIAEKLREQDLVKDPQVTVRVNDYRGNTIYILGEVMQPGQYYMRGEMYLLDLIGLSMGFPNDGVLYLYRRTPVQEDAAGADGDGDTVSGRTMVTQAIPIEIRELAEGRRPDLNYKLQPGDMLYVPLNRPKYFYVTGDVNRTGSFEIPPRRELLVSEAMAFAGGPTRTAKISKGILVRQDENGQRQELALDFNAILRGKKPDFPIQQNDIIFIPGSSVKTLGQGVLGIVPNLLLAW